MTNDTSRCFEALRASLDGRLDPALLEDALEYLDHAEWGLALEALADHLHEHGVRITGAERALFEELRRTMHIAEERLAFLDELVE